MTGNGSRSSSIGKIDFMNVYRTRLNDLQENIVTLILDFDEADDSINRRISEQHSRHVDL
jgi:hypothetical protein